MPVSSGTTPQGAVTVAAVSGLEVVMFRRARRVGLLRRAIPDDVYRWGILMSLSPVAFFAASVPIAFYSVGLAVAGLVPRPDANRRHR